MYDAVVVGGGPAGLSAALWLGRYRRSAVVVDSREHRNRWVDQAHGYLGSDPFDPAALRDRALQDLAAYADVEIRNSRVMAVARRADASFTAELEDGTCLETRRLILATGVRDAFPEVEGFFEHYGASVFHCPTCDGYEARDRDVVVFGWSEDVRGFALTLLGWARSVTIVTDGRSFEGDRWAREHLAANRVRILEDAAVGLVGERGRLRGVRLRGGEELRATMAFFSIAHHPNADLADELGCRRDGDRCVVVDQHGATTVPGVYAAGDLTPGLQLVQVAAAKGTVAGVACAQSLRGEGGVPEGWLGRVRGYSGPMTNHDDATSPAAERLEQLGDEIDDVRDRVADQRGEDDPKFHQTGDADQAQPVDDAIAPPG